MATTNNRSWKALLPRNGGIGVCPQIGRVKIPPVCPRSTLNLTGGRRIKTVRACWFEGDEARQVAAGGRVEARGRAAAARVPRAPVLLAMVQVLGRAPTACPTRF